MFDGELRRETGENRACYKPEFALKGGGGSTREIDQAVNVPSKKGRGGVPSTECKRAGGEKSVNRSLVWSR